MSSGRGETSPPHRPKADPSPLLSTRFAATKGTVSQLSTRTNSCSPGGLRDRAATFRARAAGVSSKTIAAGRTARRHFIQEQRTKIPRPPAETQVQSQVQARKHASEVQEQQQENMVSHSIDRIQSRGKTQRQREKQPDGAISLLQTRQFFRRPRPFHNPHLRPIRHRVELREHKTRGLPEVVLLKPLGVPLTPVRINLRQPQRLAAIRAPYAFEPSEIPRTLRAPRPPLYEKRGMDRPAHND